MRSYNRFLFFLGFLVFIVCFGSVVNANSQQPSILLVEDAHYLYSNEEISPYYETALSSNGYTYDTYIVNSGQDDGPNLTILNQYDIVIWFTGNDGRSILHNTLTKTDETNLKEYLDNGGKLFLSGQDIGFDRGYDPDNTGFYSDNLHAYFCKDNSYDYSLSGISNNPIGDGLLIDIDGGLGNQKYPSIVYFQLGENFYFFTNTVFRYGLVPGSVTCDDGNTFSWLDLFGYFKITPINGATNYDSGGPTGYKLVYFAFGFEGISDSDNRKEIMKRIIEYLSAPDVQDTVVSSNLTNSNPVLTSKCVDGQHLSHVAGAEYFIDQTPNESVRGTPLNPSDGSFDELVENINGTIDISSLNDGNHTIYVRCEDKDGYWGKFDSVNFTKDTTAPAVPLILIQNDATYTNKEKPTLNIYDSSYGDNTPDYIRFSCDGASWTSWITWRTTYSGFNITSGPGCTNSDGTKYVYIQAKDEAGNIQSTIKSDSIILDRVNPSVVEISPANNSFLNSEANITINLSDDRSGIDSSNLKFYNGIINQSFTANESFNPGWTSEGQNTLKAYIYDNAGNLLVKTYSYKVDNTPPVTTDNSSSSWTATNQSILLNCTDSYSGCSYITYCVGNDSCAPANAINNSQYFVEINCSVGEVCQKYVRYRSNDSAGNLESIKTSNLIRIDKQTPSVIINSPTAGYVNGEIIINATISESGSGINVAGFNITNSTYSSFKYLYLSGDYWISSLDTTQLLDGLYNITFYVNDSVGNLNNTEKVQIFVDNTVPTTTDNSTSNWTSQNQTIQLQATDTGSGVNATLYCIDTTGTCQPSIIYTNPITVGCSQNNTCQKYVRYRSNDSAGNLESIKTSNLIRIDKTSPQITISNPEAGKVYSGIVEILTEITDSGSGTKEYANYTILNATDYSVIYNGILNQSDSWDASWNSSGYSGEIIFNITAKDLLDNPARKNVSFFVNAGNVSAVIIDPKKAYKNQSFNLNLKAFSSGTINLTNASYYIKNSSGIVQSNISSNINSQNFTFTDLINFSDSKWIDGNYSINFTAFNSLDKSSNDSSWFYIDTNTPTTSDNVQGIWSSEDIEVTLNCQDNGSGCLATYYCINVSSYPCNSFDRYTNPFVVSCAENEICNKTVHYYSIDNAGNSENVKASEFILIDKRSPTTTDNSTSNWTSQNQTIQLQATDTGSGVNATLYCIDTTGTCQPSIIYTNPITVGCSQNNTCQKYVRYRSNDSAGNLESIKTSNLIRIDKTSPITELSSNGSDWVSHNISFSLTCTDIGSGCFKTYYKIINDSQQCSSVVNFTGGSSGEITCSANQECIKKLCYFSQDVVGNNESVKESAEFKIDFKPPEISNITLNVSTDSFYGNKRIYPGDLVQLNISASDPSNISQINLTLNSVNYTLTRVSGNNSYGTWQRTISDTDSLGNYILQYLYLKDSVGNMRILNSTDINLSFEVVNGSFSVFLNNTDSVNAGDSANLSLNFLFNFTAINPFLRIAIPPNNFSGAIEEPRYTNLTEYVCLFGNYCNESLYLKNSDVSLINLSMQGSGRNLSVSSILQAGKPLNNTNDTWALLYKNLQFSSLTHIHAPKINISNISCNVTGCSAGQNKSFVLNVSVENVRDSYHTGNLSFILLNVTNSVRNDSATIQNLISNQTSVKSFTFRLPDVGNYTFTFFAHTLDNIYNATKIMNITVVDTTPPNITSLSWQEDNIINVNSSIVLYATITDNSGVNSVWATVEHNSSENKSFSLDSGSIKSGIWKLEYNNTSEAGRYNITRIYANDTSGNIFSINPSDFSTQFSHFDVKSLITNLTFGQNIIQLNRNQTINLTISNNGSQITIISAKIMKPRNFNETITLNLKNVINNTFVYTGKYSNVTRSGNYTVIVNVSAGTNRIIESSFYGLFGNFSIKSPQTNLTFLDNTENNVSWIVIPYNGDISGANISLASSNTSILNISGDYTLLNIFYENYSSGRKIPFILRALNTGEVNLTLSANSTSDNEILSIPVSVVSSDNEAPTIIESSKNYDTVNILEPVRINVLFNDNTFIKEAVLHVVFPNSSQQENISMTPTDTNVLGAVFRNTTTEGNYSYTITLKDSGNNTASISGNFSVTSLYNIIANTDYNLYNKGETINVTIGVNNVNSEAVSNYNLTLILDKAGTNETLINDSRTTYATYTIKASDPPSGDIPAKYTIYASVHKDNNTGEAQKTINVSKILNTVFIFPQEMQAFNVGEDVPIRVNITNARGAAVSKASVLARCISCKNAGGEEFLQLKFNSSSGLYYSNSFVAPKTSTNKFTIALYAMDSFKNYQGDPATPPFVVVSTQTGSSSSGTSSSGGISGGGISLLNIKVISPNETLPANTTQALVQISTSEEAQCEYYSKEFTFGKGIPFNTKNNILHYFVTNVKPGNSYVFQIICKSGSKYSKSSIAFTVSRVKLYDFKVKFPQQIRVVRGENITANALISNTGTLPIKIIQDLIKNTCCNVSFSKEISIKEKSDVYDSIKIHVPLNVPLGNHILVFKFENASVSKERSLKLIVFENSNIKTINAFKEQLNKIESEIKDLKTTGMDTTKLELLLNKLRKNINGAQNSIQEDNLKNLKKYAQSATDNYKKLMSGISSLRLAKFFRENWWKFVLYVLAFYILIYIVSILIFPYITLKQKINSLMIAEKELMQARKKAEHQYFNREISRETFIGIMVAKQNEILKLRGQIDETQERLKHFFRERLHPKMFFKAPAITLSEISESKRVKNLKKKFQQRNKTK